MRVAYLWLRQREEESARRVARERDQALPQLLAPGNVDGDDVGTELEQLLEGTHRRAGANQDEVLSAQVLNVLLWVLNHKVSFEFRGFLIKTGLTKAEGGHEEVCGCTSGVAWCVNLLIPEAKSQ